MGGLRKRTNLGEDDSAVPILSSFNERVHSATPLTVKTFRSSRALFRRSAPVLGRPVQQHDDILLRVGARSRPGSAMRCVKGKGAAEEVRVKGNGRGVGRGRPRTDALRQKERTG